THRAESSQSIKCFDDEASRSACEGIYQRFLHYFCALIAASLLDVYDRRFLCAVLNGHDARDRSVPPLLKVPTGQVFGERVEKAQQGKEASLQCEYV
ncbi:hypothetical protein V5799_024486, partial [Amblyomma americanum]